MRGRANPGPNAGGSAPLQEIDPLNGKSPLTFFLLLAALGTPFFVLAGVQVFPNISLFNFAAFLPVTSALILVYRENGTGGMVELLRRSFGCCFPATGTPWAY